VNFAISDVGLLSAEEYQRLRRLEARAPLLVSLGGARAAAKPPGGEDASS
jgi:hypothetical protein